MVLLVWLRGKSYYASRDSRFSAVFYSVAGLGNWAHVPKARLQGLQITWEDWQCRGRLNHSLATDLKQFAHLT